MIRPPPISTRTAKLFPYTTRFRSTRRDDALDDRRETVADRDVIVQKLFHRLIAAAFDPPAIERAVMPHHHRRRMVEPLDQQAGFVPDRNRPRAERARKDRKSTRLNSSHSCAPRMQSSAVKKT